MNESYDQTFIDGIVARPDDVQLRLIYADWLEEQGDPRGEFIRVCHAMEGLPVLSSRYQQLSDKREALRNQVDSEWESQLGYRRRYLPLFTELPAALSARSLLLDEFAKHWLPGPHDKEPAEMQLRAFEDSTGQQLPAFFRQYYLHVTSYRSPAGSCVDLRYARIRDGFMDFYTHPYGLRVTYGFEFGREDPEVLQLQSTEWEKTGESLSTFLLKALLCETDRAGEHWYIALPPSESKPYFDELRQVLTACDWNQERHSEPQEFFEGRDIIATIEDDVYLFLSCRHDSALQVFSQPIRDALRKPLKCL